MLEIVNSTVQRVSQVKGMPSVAGKGRLTYIYSKVTG
jgi:hypothetical protein